MKCHVGGGLIIGGVKRKEEKNQTIMEEGATKSHPDAEWNKILFRVLFYATIQLLQLLNDMPNLSLAKTRIMMLCTQIREEKEAAVIMYNSDKRLMRKYTDLL